MRNHKVISLVMLMMAVLLQACGQNKPASPAAGTFAQAEATGGLTAEERSVISPDKERANGPQKEAGAPDNPLKDAETGTVAKENEQENGHEEQQGKESPVKDKSSGDKAAKKTPSRAETSGGKQPSKTETVSGDQPAKTVPEKQNTANKEPRENNTKVNKQVDGEPKTKQTSAVPKTLDISAKKTDRGPQSISWSGFFDGEDQTTPSEQFWDLSGSTVTIKGFMGEVLSFEKNWFLLIPEPGAECPFDNGDETYWNKIMIVFVPDDVKLRYKSEPLQVTGRLDVGIKIDESGYKTMFRLYDASFKEIKE
ncbi:hypothetical protein [Paenibacillus sp. A14]|uniref:hypothetical protein n=1 Tax=Paenibacillus sp. A14 TaxID=3119820 RepID=UPI002FDF2A27